jgi:hypothetical protein
MKRALLLTPCKIADLSISRVQGTGAGGIIDVDGTSKVEGCAEEGASEVQSWMDQSTSA